MKEKADISFHEEVMKVGKNTVIGKSAKGSGGKYTDTQIYLNGSFLCNIKYGETEDFCNHFFNLVCKFSIKINQQQKKQHNN